MMKEVTQWLITYFPVAWSAHICQVHSHHVMSCHVMSLHLVDPLSLSAGSGDGHPRSQSALPGAHGGCGQQGDQLHLDCAGGGQLPRHPGCGGRVQGEDRAEVIMTCV